MEQRHVSRETRSKHIYEFNKNSGATTLSAMVLKMRWSSVAQEVVEVDGRLSRMQSNLSDKPHQDVPKNLKASYPVQALNGWDSEVCSLEQLCMQSSIWRRQSSATQGTWLVYVCVLSAVVSFLFSFSPLYFLHMESDVWESEEIELTPGGRNL